MISFKQFLSEARMASLYHGTTASSAANIIKTNIINSNTSHYIGVDDNYRAKGVSLSRSFEFSKSFKGESTSLWVVFELNQEVLTHNNKVVPINYWNSGEKLKRGPARRPDLTPRDKRYNEAEEFVIGSVKNADKAILKIHVNPRMFEIGSYDDIIRNHSKLFIKGRFVNK